MNKLMNKLMPAIIINNYNNMAHDYTQHVDMKLLIVDTYWVQSVGYNQLDTLNWIQSIKNDYLFMKVSLQQIG